MTPLHKLRRALLLFGAAAMAIGFPNVAMAAESGPVKTQIYQNSSGDLVFVMTEPEEYEDQVFQVLGCDLTTFDEEGDKDSTFRFMFDESQTERSYNSSHTEIVVTKYISAEDIKAGLTEESRTLWNHYLAKYGEFILDSVIAVSNDGGQTYSGYLAKTESEGVATAVPNYAYSDAPLVLSLDNDGDMVFGEGEESRLLKVYSWSDTGTILDFYNQPLTTRNVDEEDFNPSSYQHSSDSYPSENERYETFTTWQSGGEDPYYVTYNDSRLYYNQE
ncbi:MAG: hypothetical protein LUE86_12935 [Clostridiales bacterium]|nr:hypothetical protein [Clostridiales bacterium]